MNNEKDPNKKINFLQRNVIDILKAIISDLYAIGGTFLLFFLLALPVLISIFILWYLAGFPRLTI